MRKRILSVLLVVMMLIGIIPMSTMTASAAVSTSKITNLRVANPWNGDFHMPYCHDFDTDEFIDGRTFKWDAYSGASRYRVKLIVDGTVVKTINTLSCYTNFKPDKAGIYAIKVEAISSTGAVLATSTASCNLSDGYFNRKGTSSDYSAELICMAGGSISLSLNAINDSNLNLYFNDSYYNGLSGIEYKIVEGPDWLGINSKGVISGTVPSDIEEMEDTRVTVAVKKGNDCIAIPLNLAVVDEQSYFIQDMTLDITNSLAIGSQYNSSMINISGRKNDVRYHSVKTAYGIYEGSPIGGLMQHIATDLYINDKNGKYTMVKEGSTIQIGHYYAYSYFTTKYADVTGDGSYSSVFFTDGFKLKTPGCLGAVPTVYRYVSGIGDGNKNALRVEIPLCMYDVKPQIQSVVVNGTQVSDGETIQLENGDVQVGTRWDCYLSDALVYYGCSISCETKKYVDGVQVDGNLTTVKDGVSAVTISKGNHAFKDLEYVTELYVTWPDGFKDLVDTHTVTVKTGSLHFSSLTPEVSNEELWKGYSYLGEVEYGTELNFGFTAEPLSQALINVGFSIEEEITVGYEWQGTVVKLSSGAEFDLMKYVSKMGTYQIIYSIHLYKNEEYVTTKGFYYEVDVVTGTADSLAATLDHPVAGNLPSDVVYDDSDGAYIYNIQWSYFDENATNPDWQWSLMPDDMEFEEGKRYQCTITYKPDEHYTFPETAAEIAARVNGYKATVVANPYATNKCYVEYEFITSHAIDIGDVQLKDGECLWNDDDTIHTELPSSGYGYAYYERNTLVLNHYKNPEATIQFRSEELDIYVINECNVGAIYDGSFYVGSENSDKIVPGNLIIEISSGSRLEIEGEAFDAYAALRVYGDVLVKGSGELYILDSGNIYSELVAEPETFTVDGAEVYVLSYSNDYAIFASDSERKSVISVKSGLLAASGVACAMNNCTIEKGLVYVSVEQFSEFEDCTLWDGVTDLSNYKTVWVRIPSFEFEKQPVLGAEIEKGLYEVSWETSFNPVKTEIYKLCENNKEAGYVLDAEVTTNSGYMYHLTEYGEYTDYYVRAYYNETEYVDSNVVRVEGSDGGVDITYVGLYYLDGQWVYLKEGRIDTTFTGMAQIKNVWWYVKDGILDATYTGVVEYEGELWYVKSGKFLSTFTGMLVYGGKCIYFSKGKHTTAYTGMAQNSSGLWYIKNGVFDATYTGLAWYVGKYIYVNAGKHDPTYTGIAEYNDNWFYVKNGVLDITYTGMASYGEERWYVNKGKFDATYTGIVKDGSTCVYVKSGKFDATYTGMAKNSLGLWYMKDGVLDVTYTGLAWYVDKYIYVNKGKFDATYTGMAEYKGNWYYVKEGIIDATYTGMATYGTERWYVVAGKFASTYTGMVKDGSTCIYVKAGKFDATYTGMAKNSIGLWYMKDGVLDVNYTGLAWYVDKYIYVNKGKFDAAYTGMAEYKGNWYYVKEGVIDATYTGMVAYGTERWYVKAGKFASTYTGMVKDGSTWIYVNNGKFDPTYTGAAQNAYGWWYIKNGKFDTSYSGTVVYEGNTYNVTNGKVEK